MFSHIHTASPPRNKRSGGFSIFSGLIAALSLMMLLSVSAQAATPPVGSVISNQASANYTDGSGTVKTATSNLVTTTVVQVAALDLVTDNTKTVVSGSTVYMPHTLTNLGNGSDTFTFNIVDNTDDFTLTSTALYLDANADGVPDSATPLCTGAACAAFTTPSLGVGGTYSFVLAAQVPITATGSQSDSVAITAKSVFDNTQTKLNTDTVNVTVGPAFNVTKSINIASGAASPASCVGPSYADGSCIKVKYTLTYTNTGGAGNLYLSDVIGTGATAGMAYVPGSARWSSAPATPLTDAASGDPSGIDYQFNIAPNTNTIQAVIANVGAGVSGTVTFDVAILSTATPGSASTTNTANYGVSTTSTVGTAPTLNPTNPSPYTVGFAYNVVANNSSASSTVGVTDATPTSGALPTDDANLVFINGATTIAANTAAPGTTVSFDNYIWNTGSGSDTFNIALAAIDAFPSGTVFQIFKADGVTPLADSNADGIPDTGPLAVATSYKVVVKAVIPAAACTPSCPSGPFTESVTATSVADPAKSNKAYDRLSALSAPTVDLTNSAAGNGAAASGSGGDVGSFVTGGTPTTTNTIASGAATSFPLFVKNNGSSSDNYNLDYSTSNFAAGTVPAGWTVVFRKTDANSTTVGGACTTGAGSVITNTGNVSASGGQIQVCAFVTTPVSAPAGTSNLYFRVLSGATGASDIKLDAVTITANPQLSLTPNGSGQVYPGGSVLYPHVLTNTGNTSCSGTFAVTDLGNVLSGWSAIVYDDVNGNGVIDSPADVVLGSHNGSTFTAGSTPISGPLAIGATHKLLVKVIAPAGASSGDADNITISVNDGGAASCGTATANDTTLVITGQLRLNKLQAIDVDCNGADGAFATTALTTKPGGCIVYQITATNEGTTDVTAITVSDATPSFTSYFSAAAALSCSTGALLPASPADGYTGTLSCGPIATMIPGATATMTFGVKVDQ